VSSNDERTRGAIGVPPCAFYTVADRRHFIGAVALLNSLRLAGHTEPICLVDAGLTDAQREMLDEHMSLLAPPVEMPPVYMAPLGPLARPADVAIIIDADIIVLRTLTPLVDLAAHQRVVGFVNDPPNHVRFFPEWATLLGLRFLRHRPYLNAGLFVIPRPLGDRLLGLWLACQEKIDYGRTRYGAGRMSDPFYFADQDVVNAVLSAELGDDEIECLEHRWAPHTPLRGIRIVDERQLICEHSDGSRPYLLHHTLAKPWLQATEPNAYSRLLPRLLFAADVVVRLSPRDVPLRLRAGLLASADRYRCGVQARVRQSARRQLGRFGIRTRLAARRAARFDAAPLRSADDPPAAATISSASPTDRAKPAR
jgi:hypothetical protein